MANFILLAQAQCDDHTQAKHERGDKDGDDGAKESDQAAKLLKKVLLECSYINAKCVH